MASECSQPLRDPEIVALARSLLERRREIADGMAGRIQTEVDFYRSGTVSLDDLRASCDRNLEMILWPSSARRRWTFGRRKRPAGAGPASALRCQRSWPLTGSDSASCGRPWWSKPTSEDVHRAQPS